ncbi:hypothetical protein [Clostridium tertium]|uniref:hypothetical protein n=1 Tax=Clostridium tertium TaxID=1559 RepID=UPI003DA45047
MAKAAYPTIGIAALVMFGIVYFIGCLQKGDTISFKRGKHTYPATGVSFPAFFKGNDSEE